jgi:hypothetical protein
MLSQRSDRCLAHPLATRGRHRAVINLQHKALQSQSKYPWLTLQALKSQGDRCMSQVTVSPGAGLSNARGNTPDLTLIAQSTPGATPPAQQRLQTLPNGEGEVAVRDKDGNTLATNLKARQVLRDGQWRSEGFVAERISAFSAIAPHGNAQPEPNGHGYLRAEHGKMRVITGRNGRVITDLAQARARTSELIRHGGLSMTTDAQAQTAKEVKLRQPSMPMVTATQVTPWKPVIPLPKPIEKMSPVDRAKYMVKEALRVAPASVRKELQGLLRPENLALMAGFAAAQAVPGVNMVVDVVASLMLGKEVTESGIKIISAIHSGLSTQQPYELVEAGDRLAEAFSHLGVGVGIALIGGVAARGAGKSGTRAAPVERLSLPQPKKLQGANNIVAFARPLRSKASGRPGGTGGNGSAQGSGRPRGSAVATASAPARAGTALANARRNGAPLQGNQASRTPVPAVLPLPTVRAAAVLPLPLPAVQTRPEDIPLPEKRRGAGDEPRRVEPGVTRTPAEETKLKAWLRRQGDPLREQQLNAYREGRITDKQDVLGGRTGADRERMSAALDKIDRARIGPSRGGGAGRSHTTAELKTIWRRIDKRGGVDALPEATLREVTGITEQALKDTRLTPAERSDFTHRLAGARQAQRQHHKARAATKNQPPVDPSSWNLPMGESVFGKRPDSGTSFPGLIQPAGRRRPASLTAPVTFIDPRTGAIVNRDASGRLRSLDPNAPTNITASQPDRSFVDVPSLQSLERIGFQRNGLRLQISVGDYSVVADVWGQKDPREIIDLRDLPKDNIHSSQDLVDRVAQTLATRAPPGAGWSVKAVGPAATVGATLLGAHIGDYLDIGHLQAAVDEGAVLYDPNAAFGMNYRLNTRVDADGDAVLVVPLRVSVGTRATVSPTSIPGMPPLGMRLAFSRSSEIRTRLEGKVNSGLLDSINSGLNNPLAKRIAHTAGSSDYRHGRLINFALPGTLAREGSYHLPEGWFTLRGQLVPASKRNDLSQWFTSTSGIGSVGMPKIFGMGFTVGFRTQRVEKPGADYRRAIRETYDMPEAGGTVARPQSIKPFFFTATSSDGSLTELLPDNPSEQRRAGEWVQPDVIGSLSVPRNTGRPAVPMPGAVLNAINGHKIDLNDVPLIAKFIRSLQTGPDARAVDQTLYDVMRGLTIGQAMSIEGQQSIRRAIHEYASERP